MSFFSVMWSFELGLMSLNQQRVKWTVALYLTLFSFCLSSLLLSGGVGSPCRGGEADGGAPEWGEASRGKNKVRSERGQEASSLIPFPIVPSVSSKTYHFFLFYIQSAVLLNAYRRLFLTTIIHYTMIPEYQQKMSVLLCAFLFLSDSNRNIKNVYRWDTVGKQMLGHGVQSSGVRPSVDPCVPPGLLWWHQ